MVGEQDLVAGLELDRAQHRVDAAAGVVDEHQVLGRTPRNPATRPAAARSRGASGGADMPSVISSRIM